MDMTTNTTAAELLAHAMRVVQVDVYFEDASETTAARTRKAIATGFLAVTAEGEFTLTAKGAEYLAGAK